MLGLQDPGTAGRTYNGLTHCSPRRRSAIARSPAPHEADLLARCLRRSSGAWEEFLAQYRGVLERSARATLLRAMGSAPDDDIEAEVEATLLALVKEDQAALRAFSGRSSLGGYLQAIASKIALNHIRGERRKGWLRFRPLDADTDAPAPTLDEADPQRMAGLRRGLQELPPRDRLILKLFHLDGASYREIA